MANDIQEAISCLRRGQAPGNREILREISVGQDLILDFWRRIYLTNYIAQGGSKIKFLTGRQGSGKTHLVEMFSDVAEDLGYLTVSFSGKEVWLHDFKEVYVAVLHQVNLTECLRRCSLEIIRQLGFMPEEIPHDMSFADYLSSAGKFDPLTKREIREQLRTMFQVNPMLDNNFALACASLTGGILGYPLLEDSGRNLLYHWLESGREVKLASLRLLGLSPSKITKYNARHMLRSLVEVCCLAGFKGLVISIDNMDVLINAASDDNIRYTRMKREDAYESLRQLIDEIDVLHHIMFVLSFERSLIDDDLKGLKSYQALWMRIQNEIEAEHFNYFADIVDLDRFIDEVYTPEMIMEMSKKIARIINQYDLGASPLTLDLAEELCAKSRFGKISLPRRVALTTLQEGAK